MAIVIVPIEGIEIGVTTQELSGSNITITGIEVGGDGTVPNPMAGWFHTKEEKSPQENEDRLNYLAKEISLNAPHRTIKANTRPSAR